MKQRQRNLEGSEVQWIRMLEGGCVMVDGFLDALALQGCAVAKRHFKA